MGQQNHPIQGSETINEDGIEAIKELEDGEVCSKKEFSAQAIILMKSLKLWLSAQDEHKIGPINISS